MINKIGNLLLAGAKSFWGATVNTAWGIATFFLLGALVGYYEADTSLITGLFRIIYALMSNWQLVWCVLFIFELLVNYKELTKARKKE